MGSFKILDKASPLGRKSQQLCGTRCLNRLKIKLVGLISQRCHLGRSAGLPSPGFCSNGTVGRKSDEIGSKE